MESSEPADKVTVVAAEVVGRLERYFKLIPDPGAIETPLGITRYAGLLIQQYNGKTEDNDIKFKVEVRVENI